MATKLRMTARGLRWWLSARAFDPFNPHRSSSWFPALVDTGASFSAVPAQVISELEQRTGPLGYATITDFTLADGSTSAQVPTLLDLDIRDTEGTNWRSSIDLGHAANGVLVLSLPHIIIGVDLLRYWRLVIDGPASTAIAETGS